MLFTLANPALALSLRVEPDQATIGETEIVSLIVEDGAAHKGKLRIAVEAGTVGEFVAQPDGGWRARWKIPSTLVPRRIAAGVVNTSTGVSAFATLALSREARFRFKAHPGADVQLVVRGEVVASGTADADGRLEVPVLVPPGADVASAQQRIRQGRDVASKVRELGIRNHLRIWGVAVAEDIVPDGRTGELLYLFAYRDTGPLSETPEIVLTTDEGRSFVADPLGAGVFRVAVVAGPPQRSSKENSRLHLTAVVSQGGERAEFEHTLPWRLLPPTAVTVLPPEGPWTAGNIHELLTQITDKTGRGVASLHLEPVLLNGSYGASLDVVNSVAIEPGHYRIALQTPRTLPEAKKLLMVVRVAPEGPASLPIDVPMQAGPPARLEIKAAKAVDTSVRIRMNVEDVYGNPAPASQLKAEVDEGSLENIEPTGEGVFETRWAPREPRRSVRVALAASVAETEVRAEESFWYRAPQTRLTTSARVGFAGSLDGALVPTASVTLGFKAPSFSEDLLFVLDVAGGRFVQSESAPGVSHQSGIKLKRTMWFLPVVMGVAYRWLPAPRWAVRLGAGSGALISLVSAGISGLGDAPPSARDVWGTAWLAQGWASIGWQLGPGAVGLQVRAWDTIAGDPGWAGRPHALSLLLGYSLGHFAQP